MSIKKAAIHVFFLSWIETVHLCRVKRRLERNYDIILKMKTSKGKSGQQKENNCQLCTHFLITLTVYQEQEGRSKKWRMRRRRNLRMWVFPDIYHKMWDKYQERASLSLLVHVSKGRSRAIALVWFNYRVEWPMFCFPLLHPRAMMSRKMQVLFWLLYKAVLNNIISGIFSRFCRSHFDFFHLINCFPTDWKGSIGHIGTRLCYRWHCNNGRAGFYYRRNWWDSVYNRFLRFEYDGRLGRALAILTELNGLK